MTFAPRLRPSALLSASLLIALLGCGSVEAAAPPVQPAEGPGGVGDKAATIAKRVVGTASSAAYVFHKVGPAPAEGRPVAIFMHAWGVPNPQAYGGWIDHLARQGYLVLYPRFQEVNRTRPTDASTNAERIVKATLEALAADADAKPDPKRVAVIGHLAGVPIAFNLAAQAAGQGLPVPKIVFAMMPGGIASTPKARGVTLGSLGDIAPATLLVAVIGDKDARAADAAARRLLRESSAVPPERKLIVRALSDDHGFPALTATLASAAAMDAAFDGTAIKVPPDPKDYKAPPFKWSADMALTGEQTTLVAQINNARADSLDYLAYWKTFDLAAAAAFSGGDAASLKMNPRFADMERWADGWPVKRLAVESPRFAPVPTSAQSNEPAPARAGRR